jgi:hypothetical protein
VRRIFLAGSATLFSDAGLPTYRTPEGTITAFMHMVEYRRNQKQLRETPVLPESDRQYREAHMLLQQAIEEGATTLDTHEVSPVLGSYGIHTLPTWIAATAPKRCILPSRLATGRAEAAFAGYPAQIGSSGGHALPAYRGRSAAGRGCDYRSRQNGLAPGAIHGCWCKAWPTAPALRSCGWWLSTIPSLAR